MFTFSTLLELPGKEMNHPNPLSGCTSFPQIPELFETWCCNPTRISQEHLNLPGSGVEPRHTSPAQLGPQLHVKGLACLMKDRVQQTLQEMERAVEDSKIEV